MLATARYIQQHNPRAAELLLARAGIRRLTRPSLASRCRARIDAMPDMPRVPRMNMPRLRPPPASTDHAAARHESDTAVFYALAFCWVPFASCLTLYLGLDCWLAARERLDRDTGLVPTVLSLTILAAWFAVAIG